jgi:rRNA-processing protein EBP2
MQTSLTPANCCPTPCGKILISSLSPEKQPGEEVKPKKQVRQKNLNYKEELKSINQKLVSRFNLRFSQNSDKEAPLVEHQSVVGGDPPKVSTEINVKLELQREAQFFSTALANCKQTLVQLQNKGVKLERPTDFYAEMFKSDAQMEKISSRLEKEKKRIEDFETKKKQKQNVKFHKRLKHKRQLEAAKEKKEGLRAIESWKQKIRKGDSNAELNFKQNKKVGMHSFVNQKTRKRANNKKKRLGKSRRITKQGRK